MCCTNCYLRFLGVTKMIINALFENFNGSDRSLAKNRESRETLDSDPELKLYKPEVRNELCHLFFQYSLQCSFL